MALGFVGRGREREREKGERERERRERDKRLRALGHARGHTLGYIGGGGQVSPEQDIFDVKVDSDQ